MKQFYTSNGWEGKKYEQSKRSPLKVIAQQIKAEILKAHPEIKVSVSTEHFSGGCAVNVKVTSAPFKLLVKKCIYPEMANLPEAEIPKYAWGANLTDQAQAVLDDITQICNAYRYDDSDGMIDYFNTNFYCTPEYSWDLRLVEEKELGIM